MNNLTKIVTMIKFRLFVILAMISIGCSNQKPEVLSNEKRMEKVVDSIASNSAKNSSPQRRFSAFSSNLVVRTIFNEIEVLFPKTFKLMDDEMIALKYRSKQGTTFMAYTDEDAIVNIAFEHTLNKAMLKDLPAIKQVLDGQFNRPQIDFQKSEIRKINSRDFIILEMITPAMDMNVYNLMFITSLEDRMMMGTFNCTVDKVQQWKPTAYQILNSITIKN